MFLCSLFLSLSLLQSLNVEAPPEVKAKLLELGLAAFLQKAELGACIEYIRSIGIEMVEDLISLEQVNTVCLLVVTFA